MKRHVLSLLLGLSAGSASATFELSDPANEMLEEQRAAAQPGQQQPAESGPLCVTDSEVDRCWCFDRQSGDRVSLSEDECRERAAKRSGDQES